jgi:hypothetical protein
MTAALWGRHADPGHGIAHPGMLGGWTGTGDRKAAQDGRASNHQCEVYRSARHQGERCDVAGSLGSGCGAATVGRVQKGR